MKKLLLFFFLALYNTIAAQSPQLWGLTLSGGQGGEGAIIKINGDGTGFSTPYSWPAPNPPGVTPYYGNLIQASDGLLYGMTYGGGANTVGVIFSYNPADSSYTNLYNFAGDSSSGAFPSGSLVQASDGLLYGMAYRGGANGGGVIFSYNPSDSSYVNLYSFTGYSPVAGPTGSLIQASDGLLYGMTNGSDLNDSGVIFSFNPANSIYTNLYSFADNSSSGANPQGSLLQAYGLLYGMTESGGANGEGVIFSFNPANSAYTNLYNFANDNSSGANPLGNLIQASNGLLYGMTYGGGAHSDGVIFSFNPADSSYTTLYNFAGGANSGASPEGSLIQAANGLLYGLTYEGGKNSGYSNPDPNSDGVIFSYNLSDNTYTNLYNFAEDSSSGANPEGSLIQASNGLLYGMTYQGGVEGDGVIFSYNTTARSYTNLDNFGVYTRSGALPFGNLIQSSDGLLYGMASEGGAGGGLLFTYNPVNGTCTNLYYFGTYGYYGGYDPVGSLIQASNGLLYGMTQYGGAYHVGVIFSYSPTNNTYTEPYEFAGDDSSGADSWGSLIQASDGLLYGMTWGGGCCGGYGVIFSFNPTDSSYKNLYSFGDDSSSGANPNGSLIQASDGLLYGMTVAGGANNVGVIFSYNPASGAYINLYSFANNSGANPYGSLVQASDGLLYGMTNGGGVDSDGVIFSYNPVNSTYTALYSFTGGSSSGAFPDGSLIQASNGLLYGMTFRGGANGGANGAGVIFSFNPMDNVYTNLASLSAGSGDLPYGSLLQVGVTNGIIIPVDEFNVKVYPNPFSNQFYLAVTSSGGEPLQVHIYNLLGQLIASKENVSANEEISIGEGLSSGMYIVNVKQGTEEKVLRIIKSE